MVRASDLSVEVPKTQKFQSPRISNPVWWINQLCFLLLDSFGSKYRSTRTGIIYNNVMDDFSTPGQKNAFGIEPSQSNYIQPGKRPMSSMTPTIFVDSNGVPRLVLGASGGTRITTAISLVRNFVTQGRDVWGTCWTTPFQPQSEYRDTLKEPGMAFLDLGMLRVGV